MKFVTYASKVLELAHKYCVLPFPTVLVLGDFYVHVCTLYSHDVVSNIKTSFDEALGFHTTLNISYIYPNNCYVRFWKHLDNLWFRYKDIIKNVSVLDNRLNNARINWHVSVFHNI